MLETVVACLLTGKMLGNISNIIIINYIGSDGELVGMVMSNTALKSSRTFTRLNFSIPYQQFITLINYANGEGALRQNERIILYLLQYIYTKYTKHSRRPTCYWEITEPAYR